MQCCSWMSEVISRECRENRAYDKSSLEPKRTLWLQHFYFGLAFFLTFHSECSLPCCWSYTCTAPGSTEFSRIAAQNLIPLRGFYQVHPLRSCFTSPGHHILIIINYRGYGYRGQEKTRAATQPLRTVRTPAAHVHSRALLLIWSIHFPQAKCNAAMKAWTCTKMYLGIKPIDMLQGNCCANSHLSQLFVWTQTIIDVEESELDVNW